MGFFEKVKDSFTSSEFDIKGNMVVRTVKKQFKNAFNGCEIRIYKGNRFADPKSTIASIRGTSKGFDEGTGNEFKVKASWKVSKLESAFKESFGIKVNVSLPGDKGLAGDNLTLGEVSRLKK